MNKDLLKKHHFWILLGLTPLLVLIAVIMVTSSVGAAIDKEKAKIEKTKNDLNKKAPKPNDLINKVEAQLGELAIKRNALWKENWERQIGITTTKDASGKEIVEYDPKKNLFRWPVSSKLNAFNYDKDYADKEKTLQLKFGSPIPNREGEFAAFKLPEVYLSEFSNARPGTKGTGMADTIAPTTFNGGWDRILRHVTAGGWGETELTSEQVWLALEDIWIQRALLAQIKSINDQIGHFERIPVAGDTPLSRKYESRIWGLTLKVTQREADNRYVMTGSLTNLTDRLQLMGNGNTMIINVWLSADPNATPFQFRIGGEYVKGAGSTRTVKGPDGQPIQEPANTILVSNDENVLPVGITPLEIFRVEQVFDSRTVPIKRIDHLALGKTDSRYASVDLKTPQFDAYKKAEAAAAAAISGASPDLAGGPGSAGGPGRGATPGPGPGGPGFGGSGGAAASAGQLEGGGSLESVIEGNKKRYIETPTAQIRRMPVGIVLVVDQAYIQDVLLAYANAPLRFQITQMHWERFRDSLGGGSSGDGFGDQSDESQPRLTGSGLRGEGFMGGSEGGPGRVKPRGGAIGTGGPVAPRPGPGGPSGPGFGPGGPGGPGFGPMGSPGGGALTTVSENQLTSGLVELSLYGIVSLYEKYDATAGTAAATTTPVTTTPAVPAPLGKGK